MKKNITLDSQLLENFHNNMIVFSNILLLEEDPSQITQLNSNKVEYLKRKEEFLLAIEERLKQGVFYLNAHHPKYNDVNDTMLFMIHCTVVYDAIKLLYHNFNAIYPFTEDNSQTEQPQCFYKYSKQIFTSPPKKATDDKVFEYLRSLIFAHPFKTSRAKFLNGATEYCSSAYFIKKEDSDGILTDFICIQVTSTAFENLEFRYIPLHTIKEYIQSRYILLQNFSQIIEQIIERHRRKNLERKVNRAGSPIEILEDIITIFEERCIINYTPTHATELLNFSCSLANNYNTVEKFKTLLAAIIPTCCDFIDNGDEEKSIELMRIFTSPDIPQEYPKQRQLGSIKAKLETPENILPYCNHQLITLDMDKMDKKEIKMLVSIACYFHNHPYEETN